MQKLFQVPAHQTSYESRSTIPEMPRDARTCGTSNFNEMAREGWPGFEQTAVHFQVIARIHVLGGNRFGSRKASSKLQTTPGAMMISISQ